MFGIFIDNEELKLVFQGRMYYSSEYKNINVPHQMRICGRSLRLDLISVSVKSFLPKRSDQSVFILKRVYEYRLVD